MFCTKCGNQLPDGSKFCPKCGAAMGEAAAGADAPAAGASSAPAASGASAPSAKKGRKGLVIGGAAAAVAVIAVICIAVLNPFAASEPAAAPEAPQSAEAPQPEPAEPAGDAAESDDGSGAGDAEAAAEPEAPALPEAFFSDSGSYSIVNENGIVTSLAVPEAELQSLFAGNRALGLWDTNDYDAEWDQVLNEQTHYGLFNSAGELAVELDPLVASYGITGLSGLSSCPPLADGRMVLSLTARGEGQQDVCLVLDEAGSVVFTMGREDSTLPFASPYGGFHDGVLAASSSALGDILVDANGAVLVGEQTLGEDPVSLGYGFVGKSYARDKVYGYDGTPLFDAASVNAEDVTGGRLAVDQPGGAGVVCVEAERVNPYGGANKPLAGLYSVSAGTWLVPMGQQLAGYGEANDGVLWVQTSEGEDDAATPHSAIVDAQGNVVFDASMADAGMGVEEDFTARYLHDGWWGVGAGSFSSPDCLVYIIDGKYQGYEPAPSGLASYPNSGLFWV